MNDRFFLFLLFLLPFGVSAQVEILTIGGTQFSVETEVVENEWETRDTLQTIYRLVEGDREPELTFASYLDQGGDCNNLFWMRETIEVNDDELVLTSHYFQKTGMDPIPEWRKRIYTLNTNGEMILNSDKYKYYHSDEWVDE